MLIRNCEVKFTPKDPVDGLIIWDADVVIPDEDLAFETGKEKAITAIILVRPVESKPNAMTLPNLQKHRDECMQAINHALQEFEALTGVPAQLGVKKVDNRCIADVSVIL